ncbi:MAG: Mth938-like domain-containing protein [Desulfotignum sp.]|nr:Mth938-like domain-containing protein [Desulfotignum sp.]
MIDAYSFGKMIVNGKEFRKDLIILPDGSVLSPWTRKSCHRLTMEDLRPVLDSDAEILVIGTGKPGLMRPHATLVKNIQEKGITAMVMSSKRAAEKYNDLSGTSDVVAACFHLTC